MARPVKKILKEIQKHRAKNNKHFMEMWALVFNCPHCRTKAKEIQQKIREGDIQITVANAELCE